ncbi:MAG: DNA-processing protein DprA [Alphaproteobacteria bacterium]
MNFAPKNLSQQEKFDYLRLIRTENIGSITFFKLLNHFDTAKEALNNIEDMAKKGGKKSFKKANSKAIEKELKLAEKNNIKLVAFPEPEYPPLLRQIHDPPPILCVMGDINILRKKSFAIVGSRNASMLGKQTALQIAAKVGENSISIVSGMAKGIDTKAHEGSLATGTVAVLGGGVDIIYPKENAQLYERICQSGAIISEAPIGTKPIAKHFPRRNRIISGMCRGILVIEAARASGSLITANMAMEQGREVFAIPGHPSDERSRGGNRLIKEGAILVEDVDDILAIINKLSTEVHSMPPSTFKKKSAHRVSEEEIHHLRSKVLELLSPSPTDVDAILRELACPYSFLAHILLELELAGKLVHYPGNKVAILN